VRSRPIGSLPAANRVASLLQRWLHGTHHGAVQPRQLDHYLDEFVFRFNRRSSRSRGLLFYRLLEQAVQSGPITYRDIVDSQPSPAPINDGLELGSWGDLRLIAPRLDFSATI